MAEGTNRTRLGQLVADQRRRLGLSISRAANKAQINRSTWTAIEEGTRDTEDYIYALVEKVLGWEIGSIDRVLAGDDPVEAPAVDAPARPRSPVDDLADDIRRILDDSGLPEADRIQLARILLADWDREQEQSRRRLREQAALRIETWKQARGA